MIYNGLTCIKICIGEICKKMLGVSDSSSNDQKTKNNISQDFSIGGITFFRSVSSVPEEVYAYNPNVDSPAYIWIPNTKSSISTDIDNCGSMYIIPATEKITFSAILESDIPFDTEIIIGLTNIPEIMETKTRTDSDYGSKSQIITELPEVQPPNVNRKGLYMNLSKFWCKMEPRAVSLGAEKFKLSACSHGLIFGFGIASLGAGLLWYKMKCDQEFRMTALPLDHEYRMKSLNGSNQSPNAKYKEYLANSTNGATDDTNQYIIDIDFQGYGIDIENDVFDIELLLEIDATDEEFINITNPKSQSLNPEELAFFQNK